MTPEENLKLMKNSEFNNNQKNKDGKLNTILSIWYFKCKRYPNGRLMKHKARLYAHGGINNGELTTGKLILQ